MKHWPSRRILALVLGVFLALGMNLSAVQASEMAVQMAMTSDDGSSGQGECDGCGGSGDDSADAVSCAPMLNCSGMAAVLPMERGLMAPQSTEAFSPVASVAHSLIAPPDPYPPRPPDLG